MKHRTITGVQFDCGYMKSLGVLLAKAHGKGGAKHWLLCAKAYQTCAILHKDRAKEGLIVNVTQKG
jgi:hypothetical protein